MRWRKPNRYQVYLALGVSVLIAIVIGLRLGKLCAPPGAASTYCSAEATWAWLKAGGDLSLWLYLGVLLCAGIGTAIAPDTRPAATPIAPPPAPRPGDPPQ